MFEIEELGEEADRWSESTRKKGIPKGDARVVAESERRKGANKAMSRVDCTRVRVKSKVGVTLRGKDQDRVSQ